MDVTTSADTSSEALREAMITQIKDAGYTLSGPVEDALCAVERHAFVPDAAVTDAYANDIVVTKRGTQNEVLSCLSNPGIVALQRGQLDDRVNTEVVCVLPGGDVAAAFHRGTVRQGDLYGGPADSAKATVNEHGLATLRLPFRDQGLESGDPDGRDRGGVLG